MIEVIVDDRLGKKVKVKCLGDDTILDLKKVLSVQLSSNTTVNADTTNYNKLKLIKGNTALKNHITLEDYEIHDGTYLELYYN
ncbi:ubiquitin-like protein HUB1 SCDLUD_003742 [Saccharomycodes ludwigii]|uniref:ubiquitin-like protein HUB1 n=1 Tax=Saccharomycodes ludwigii TaxID=36035 RepID=UPI001E849250|nr:hypothetical protein SCDLUD_003742 [Saccharomycodes ludwigii]KAH3900737.1 hypothetical protein SCDLUD_003742 [Saccharomycodes ludwigii]